MSKPNMKKMTRDHMDVLLNIEFVLVDGYRHESSIDDRIALDALRCMHNAVVPDDPRTFDLVENLIEVEEMRPELPEQVWNECLRVIMESVRTHSTLQQGATGYLNFAAQFIR
jgi:hypothetical protein